MQTFAGNLHEERSERLVDDRYAGAGVVQQVFVFVGAEQGADRNRDGTDLDGAKETIGKFGDVGEQKEDPFFHADSQGGFQAAAEAVYSVAELGVSDLVVAAFDGSAVGAAFEEVPVYEVFGSVEVI